MKWRLIELGFVALGFLVTSGCQSVPSPVPTEITAETRQKIYARAAEELRNVVLFKPAPGGTNDGGTYLSPLLLQQGAETGVGRERSKIETVWFHRGSLSIAGREHEQRSYYWKAPGKGRRIQGIRITLGRTGAPGFWEVFQDKSGAEIIWVSQALEIEAADQFGNALPGRLCSVERALTDAPRLVVPNVVDDGPLPMGPIVYLSLDGNVPIVSCRCSSAHAQTLASQTNYTLREVDAGELRRHLVEASVPVAELEAWFKPDRLTQRLRIPAGF